MSGVAILFAAGLALPPKVLYVPEIPHEDNRCNEPDGDGSPARASSDYATRHAAHHSRRLVELKRNSIKKELDCLRKSAAILRKPFGPAHFA